MTTKEDVLQYITTLATQKFVTREELLMAYDAGSSVRVTDVDSTHKLGVAEILYFIGGGIVVLGIAVLLAQNWSTLGFAAKLLATLGAGIAAYVVGVLFSRNEKTETASSAFYLIPAFVTPIGLYIVFDHAGFDASSNGSQSLISTILLATYLASYFVFRKNVFALFSILFATWLFFALTSLIASGMAYDLWKFYEYRGLAVGLTYMLLGHSFSQNERAPLSGFLYGFGIFNFLGFALLLGGWSPSQNGFWELMFPILVFGALFLSVHLKSKSFLTWGTIFLMFYILKITSEYFSSGLGWPLALVVAGLAMIGVGYMSLSLKKKYLSA